LRITSAREGKKEDRHKDSVTEWDIEREEPKIVMEKCLSGVGN